MSARHKKILTLLFLCFLGFNVEASKGPVLVNMDVPPGNWKAIRLKNLPLGAIVSLEVKSDGEITVLLLNSKDIQQFPSIARPLFLGVVKDKLSFSVSIPESDNYHIVLDNRSGQQGRAVTVTAAADRAKTDSIKDANTILRQFERQLHQIFIFDAFHVGIERCDPMMAFGNSSGMVLCADYIQQIYDSSGNMQKAKDALGFSIFYELGRILLVQWHHPAAAEKATTDEFAAVLMIMLNHKKTLSDHVQNIVQNPSMVNKLASNLKDDHHPLTVNRAEKIIKALQDPMFVRKWQTFLVPHMQTLFLKKLRQNPGQWTDPDLVERELKLRSKKHVRSDHPWTACREETEHSSPPLYVSFLFEEGYFTF